MSTNNTITTCANCILDSNDDLKISFDATGVCNYCRHYYSSAVASGTKAQSADALNKLVSEIKHAGEGKPYDCIIGVSGGVDSTYVAYLVKKLGLRPLAVHLDYGWNSELAVANITNTLQKLDIDLYTHVVDWEEIKDLQTAFLKASVVDIELINDFAIYAVLHNQAFARKIKYVLHGMNIETEGEIMPLGWAHNKFDQLNIRSIHQKFGMKKLKTFPRLSFFKKLYLDLVYKLNWIGILNYVPYNKEEVKKIITVELGWRDYGGKHFESIFTRFYQAYILPHKFGIDKRKFHYSVLICSGQITRAEALIEMQKPAYEPNMLAEDYLFVLKKLGLTENEFEILMKSAPKSHLEFDSYLKKHYRYHANFFKLIKPITKLVKKFKQF